MRITAELLAQAEQRTNPLGERELVLQGLGIPAIENAAATRDAFDCWDISNNRIARLDNFPKLTRLSNLLCSGNLVESIDAKNLASNLPNIKYLTLSFNNISSLAEIANLGKAFPKLEYLDLGGNPVTRKSIFGE
jgi:U2 small nuclear ribonucleoprotein A'